MQTATENVVSEAPKSNPGYPTPNHFEEYLPWACNQLDVIVNLFIINVEDLIVRRKPSDTSISTKNVSSQDNINITDAGHDAITIYTTYDKCNNLIQLKFDNSRYMPRTLFKILGIILKFHIYLTRITINKGVNKVVTHELNKLLEISKITDVCLDGAAATDANYEILLENESHITYLSLSRCKINDKMVKKIASKLSHPLPASKTLTVLNLATNTITDEGAKYLARALRTNRQLAYLNLADNTIGDDGAKALLDVLKEFPLSYEEIIASRSELLLFWKDKNAMLMKTKETNVTEDGELKKKMVKGKKGTAPTEKLMTDNEVTEKSGCKNPFSSSNDVYRQDGVVYCYGNNHLLYLNLVYNSISYLTVKIILTVLSNQKIFNRTPKGLLNIPIEGNLIPVECLELNQINEILESPSPQTRKHSLTRRKSIKSSAPSTAK